MGISILHFSDAHIGAANRGKRDAATDLPIRVLDFLKSLDTIVDTAIDRRVDCVLFSGDAYDNRTPSPTLQREWGRRIMRLSKAGIPTLLLVGNHDISPAYNRAHALDGFQTFNVPYIHIADRPGLLTPEDLDGIPLQVIAVPWISRSSIMAYFDLSAVEPAMIYEKLEGNISELVMRWLDQCDPDIPIILTAHASIQGAVYGGYRTVILGSEVVLSPGLVKNKKFSYIGLGHIHKPQDLNDGFQPPVVYPGSIERVDFGEASEKKYFVIAMIEQGQATKVEWHELSTRPFISRSIHLEEDIDIMSKLYKALGPKEDLRNAMVRLIVSYPGQLETSIDESSLREYANEAFEFHLVRSPEIKPRFRLPNDRSIGSLSPLELLEKYFETLDSELNDSEDLKRLAKEIIYESSSESKGE